MQCILFPYVNLYFQINEILFDFRVIEVYSWWELEIFKIVYGAVLALLPLIAKITQTFYKVIATLKIYETF